MATGHGRPPSVEPTPGGGFDLTSDDRAAVFERLATSIEKVALRLGDQPVTQPVSVEEVQSALASHDFEQPLDPSAALDLVVDLLSRYAVHVPHPRYFGLFNPAPTFMGIAADAVTAAFNPQLRAWSHAPAAVEIERRLVLFLAARFGLPTDHVAGTFTTGGAEANQTGLIVALQSVFPQVSNMGLRSLDGDPTFYASAESHHAWFKIARASGLGERGLRLIPADSNLEIDMDALSRQISADRDAGRRPFLVVATAGTTNTGAIDPIPELADICETEGLYLHVDAAWAGAVSLSDRLRPLLGGVERADSVTVDAHKWMSVPMGAGIFIGTDPVALQRAFRVSAPYMPKDADDPIDPYAISVQWSRRFIGLKLFLSLLVSGRAGYARQLERDCQLGDALRERLVAHDWRIVNETPLPVVCFTDDDGGTAGPADQAGARIERIVDTVIGRGNAWLSSTCVRQWPVLRACITNHRTTVQDVDALVAELDAAREAVDSTPR